MQNGNTHEAGLNEAWDTARRFWAEPTQNRRALPDCLPSTGLVINTWTGSAGMRDLHPREAWHLDWERMSRPGISTSSSRCSTTTATMSPVSPRSRPITGSISRRA